MSQYSFSADFPEFPSRKRHIAYLSVFIDVTRYGIYLQAR
jgi:hypothetical protein